MSDGVIIAIIGLLGSCLGSLAGALVGARVWQYRVEQLEKKVDALGLLIERTYRLEEENSVIDEKLKVINHRINDLERMES